MDERTLEAALLPELNDDASEVTPPQDVDGQPEEGAEALDEGPAEDVEGGQGEVESSTEGTDTVPKKQYDELRKTFTQKSMELAALKRTAPQAQPVQQQPYIPQQPRTINDVIQMQVQEQLSTVLAPIQQQQQDLYYQSEMLALANKYEDFTDVAPMFLSVLEESPEFFDMQNGMERAFQAARSEHLVRVSEARTKAAVAQTRKMQAQKVAITDPSQLTKQQASGQLSTEDEIKKSILTAGGRTSIWD